MKDEIARYTFELDTFDGKDENGENINNNAVIKSVGDTMGYTALASNFQKLEEGRTARPPDLPETSRADILSLTAMSSAVWRLQRS